MPQIAVFPIVLALAVADLLAYESGWGPPLGWGLLLMVELVFGMFALSFLLAAALRVPG